MRDLRNELIQNIKLKMSEMLQEELLSQLTSVVTKELSKYEIAERETGIVPYENINTKILKTYIANLGLDGKSKNTAYMYERTLKQFSEFLHNQDLKTVTTFDIRNFLAQEKVRGISNRTLENTRSYISSFYTWLTTEDYITKNPCSAVKPIKYTVEVKKPFSAVEIDLLRSNCRNERERAIVEFLLSSGVRVSELVGLAVADIDFNTLSVHVRHGKGDKERYTYINDVTKDHLIKYLQENKIICGALFRGKRGQYTKKGIATLLNGIAERAKVQNVHPHRFRRTFATNLAYRGMSVQEIKVLMGHANINTTMVYINLDTSKINTSYRLCS